MSLSIWTATRRARVPRLALSVSSTLRCYSALPIEGTTQSTVQTAESSKAGEKVNPPTRGRKSPRTIRLQRASERRLLPQISHLTQFPDFTKPDSVLDTKAVTHIPASSKHPYSATIIEYSPYFGASLEKELPKSDTNRATTANESKTPHESRQKAEREEREARLPYPPSFVRDLHRYPLVLKRVVNQTPKGRIASFYALVVVGNGNGVMGIGEGKDKESTGTAQAKAYSEAIKGLDTVARFEDRTIFTDTQIKLGATQIRMWPRPAGFGLAVNPYIHQICKAAGIHDLSAKVIGSRNPMQVSKATMMMLHGGSAPLGFGDGVGGKGRRLEAKSGIRPKEVVERERGRKLIEGSGWL